MNSPKELKAQCPYMFSENNLGFGFTHGWFPSFAKLCTDIDSLLGENKQGFHWIQLKEKFGTARYRWGLARKPIAAKSLISASIRKLVDAAESETQDTCIYCGKPGTIQNFQGYLLVECEEHRRLTELGPRKSPWFEGDEA